MGIFSRSATSYSLVQCGLTAGRRAACGQLWRVNALSAVISGPQRSEIPTGLSAAHSVDPPQRYQWPAEAVRKYLQIQTFFKSVWGYICLTELLALDKVH